MRILLTGDFHVRKGIFVDIAIEYLNYLQNFCKEENISTIIVLGDIFEKSSNIKNEAFVPLFLKLHEMVRSGIRFYFLLGNHDIYTDKNDSIVETFVPFGTVIKSITEIIIDNSSFTLLPYTRAEENLPKSGEYLITHIPIADFAFDNAYHSNEKHAFKRELFEDFKLVFTGHFHKFQNWKNITYVGSPFQQNFKEAGQEKGFVVLDSNTANWEFHKYTGAPEFIRIDLDEFKNVDVKNKFVGINVDTKIENLVKLKYIMYERGAINVVPFFNKDESEEQIRDSLKKVKIGKEGVSIESSMEELTREFLTQVNKDGIDNTLLLKIFDNVVKEIK